MKRRENFQPNRVSSFFLLFLTMNHQTLVGRADLGKIQRVGLYVWNKKKPFKKKSNKRKQLTRAMTVCFSTLRVQARLLLLITFHQSQTPFVFPFYISHNKFCIKRNFFYWPLHYHLLLVHLQVISVWTFTLEMNLLPLKVKPSDETKLILNFQITFGQMAKEKVNKRQSDLVKGKIEAK